MSKRKTQHKSALAITCWTRYRRCEHERSCSCDASSRSHKRGTGPKWKGPASLQALEILVAGGPQTSPDAMVCDRIAPHKTTNAGNLAAFVSDVAVDLHPSLRWCAPMRQ